MNYEFFSGERQKWRNEKAKGFGRNEDFVFIVEKMFILGGAWEAQLVEHPTSAQVMLSRFVSSSSVWGSVLTVQSLELVSDSVSPSLSAPPSLSLSQINKYFFKCLFIWEREKEHVCMSGEGAEREGGTEDPKQALY